MLQSGFYQADNQPYLYEAVRYYRIAHNSRKHKTPIYQRHIRAQEEGSTPHTHRAGDSRSLGSIYWEEVVYCYTPEERTQGNSLTMTVSATTVISAMSSPAPMI